MTAWLATELIEAYAREGYTENVMAHIRHSGQVFERMENADRKQAQLLTDLASAQKDLVIELQRQRSPE